MSPRISDLLLDLEFGDAEPLPLHSAAIPIEATVEGKVYVLKIPDDDPICALIKPGSTAMDEADPDGWDDFGGIEGDD